MSIGPEAAIDWKPAAPGQADLSGALAMGAVDIWRLPLAGDVAGTALSAAEQARAARYRFAADRERFICRRQRQREILGAYLGLPPAEVTYSQDHPEKPALADNAMSFSLSYSADYALLAVSRRAVGVDLEACSAREGLQLVAKDNFKAAEIAWLEAQQGTQRLRAFYGLWARKEAVLKLLGTGLSLSPLEIAVNGNPSEPAVMVSGLGPSVAGGQWHTRLFEPAPGYVAAVARANPVTELRYFEIA